MRKRIEIDRYFCVYKDGEAKRLTKEQYKELLAKYSNNLLVGFTGNKAEQVFLTTRGQTLMITETQLGVMFDELLYKGAEEIAAEEEE